MDYLFHFWTLIVIQPLANVLALLYWWLFSNLGLAIIAATVLIRLGISPILTRAEIKRMRIIRRLQPSVDEIWGRHENKSKAAFSTMNLYNKHGVNPFGNLIPTIAMIPVWMGMYHAILRFVSPDRAADLLYEWLPVSYAIFPIDSSFLWLDLAKPDPLKVVVPILVGSSNYAVRHVTAMPSSDDREAWMNRMVLWIAPSLTGFIAMFIPSGLSLFWIMMNVAGIIIYLVMSRRIADVLDNEDELNAPVYSTARIIIRRRSARKPLARNSDGFI